MSDWNAEELFAKLKGLTLERVDGLKPGSDEVTFYTTCGRKFYMYHVQDCCEHVRIEDVVGDVEDLTGTPITLAEVVTNPKDAKAPEYPDSYTWTYYKLATIKGYVDIRWLGESNGYYSESVSFIEEK